MKLIIEVAFDHELTPQAQREVQRLVQDLKEDLADRGGTVARAELIAEPAVRR